MMPSGRPEFILVTGLKCSYGKISGPLTEISVVKTANSIAEPAIENFTKGFRGEARSRKPGQPSQQGSCQEAHTPKLDVEFGEGWVEFFLESYSGEFIYLFHPGTSPLSEVFAHVFFFFFL